MLAHDLATWLLRGPNEEVMFEVGHALWPFAEVADDYGKDHAREMDVEGQLFDTVMDVELKDSFGFKRVVKIGYKDIWVTDLEKPEEEFEALDGPCDNGEWGTSDGRINEVLSNLLELDQ